MKLNNLQSDDAILAELGHRLARRRIDRRLTQAELAARAGIGKRTLERVEAGHSAQLSTLVRIFRELDLIANLDSMLPEPGIRPLDAVRLKRGIRQRAPGERGGQAEGPWEWKDKQ